MSREIHPLTLSSARSESPVDLDLRVRFKPTPAELGTVGDVVDDVPAPSATVVDGATIPPAESDGADGNAEGAGVEPVAPVEPVAAALAPPPGPGKA